MSRLRVRLSTASAVIGVALGLLGLAVPGTPRKKLLEWGWDEPDTAFMRTNIREMEKAPFDGCVFSVRHGPGGRGGSFTWEFWGRRQFEREDLVDAFADLQATRFVRFRDNFLRVNVTPGDIDWFDDFSPVLANARLAAELARAGRVRGILLDVEQYQRPVFDYSDQRDAASRPWGEYAAQARTRGRDVMAAFQQGCPDLKVFLTFGHTLPWVLSDRGGKRLADTSYGLLAPFLDGVLEAVTARSRVIDGFELSYGFKTRREFEGARRLFETGVLPIVADPQRYAARMQLAFGLWLDYDWRRHGWDARDLSRNYFGPADFGHSVSTALEVAGQYVWIYSETPLWWTEQSPVPEAYVAAIRRARAHASPPVLHPNRRAH